MLYLAYLEIHRAEYMGPTTSFNEYQMIEALDEDDAKRELHERYDDASETYGTRQFINVLSLSECIITDGCKTQHRKTREY
jgi:hypothetical protein